MNQTDVEPSVQERPAQLFFNIEGFSLEASNNSPTLSVNGWCFSSDLTESVELQVRTGSKIISSFTCEKVRNDVEAAFPSEIVECSAVPKCGFEHWVKLPKKFKTAELYCPHHDWVLDSFSSKDIVVAESDWLVGKGDSNKSYFQVLWTIARKAKRVVSIESILSIKNWSHWLLQAKEEVCQYRQIENPFGYGGAFLTPADAFIEKNKIKPHIREILDKATNDFGYQPTISLIMPVYNVDPCFLEEAIVSVQKQIYPFWELCIADDASTREETKRVLELQNDPRIKITYRSENGHICKASNDAAALATGDFVALMDNDDLLAPHALFEIARLLQKKPDADVIYSDEDKIDQEGRHFDLHFKPDWSPTLLLGYNYINHLTCIRRSLFEDVGRFRPGYEGAQDYDLLLRVTEKTDEVFHIPKILYHWRAIPGSTALSADEKPIVGSSAYRILQEALERRGIAAEIYQPEFARRINVPVQQLEFSNDGPCVEVIIPTFNKGDILKACIDSIRKKTTYSNYRILVVDNGSTEKDTLRYLENLKGEGVRIEKVLNGSEGFSFSRINNIAVQRSDAELILFLNNDTEVIEPQWLSRMVGYLHLPGVGATGARLIYPDNSIQHAGVILGMGGGFIPDHAFCRMPREQPGYFFLPGTSRECSAVTGACLLTRRATFLEVDGFDEQDFKISLNDVDLCLKIEGIGLRTLYVSGAELYHHESLTRSNNDDPAELANFRDKYGGEHDPYYSQNLSRRDNYTVLPECTLDYADLLGRKLKVVFFTHNLNYEGAPNVLFEVARGLKEKDRVEPVIVSPCDGPQYEALVQDGLEVHVVPVRNEENILVGWASSEDIDNAIATVNNFLLQEKPDLVVSNVLNTFFVVEAAKQTGLPAIWWIHESYDPEIMAKNLQSLAFPLAEKAFLDVTNALFVSQDTRNLYRRYDLNHNHKIIHNSLDSREIRLSSDQEAVSTAKSTIGLPAGKKLIISVGTVCERKDQGTLVEAARIASQTRDDFVLYLVGYRSSLAYGDFVMRQVKEYGLEDIVKLIPETRDVETYYLAADVFLFSSLNESYSLTILEAMAHGLPIVSTRCFGVSEQVRFGVNAIEAGFKDSSGFAKIISMLLDDEDMRKRYGRNSHEMMRYMQTKDEMLKKHEQLIVAAYLEGNG